ncbi:Lytic transglycosylase SLT domain-containing protein [Desulfonema limicola]|uniref:Lytic transglycosylase SLT domain-containing protein n=1 Tax=Desulfonema limicola TaxID=45656 RepID=A0A975GHU5_9BACT|nr:lytic murein transglycosylase [Desulfonema limicola]QTA81822.1 Lytic transglycosylase SLT domain-containing protein [Desulfonema limicola]
MKLSRKKKINVFLCIVSALFFTSVFYRSVHAQAYAQNKYFSSLQTRLIQDGFNQAKIKNLYNSPGIDFDTNGVSLYFVHRESKLNYDQFLEPDQIQKAKNYMAGNQNAFISTEKAYGVDRYVITAIILVETRLGTYVGKRSVLNTLSTMAALSDPNNRAMLWQEVASSTRLSKSEFEAKAQQKSSWAYQELKAFLKYCIKENINPIVIKGSYAGAMGICQFMPSNILTLARDGNGDGKIDLFNHADAIRSVASYLNNSGWYSGITPQKAFKVVYTYNHSKYYVRTVLKIAELLRG